MAAKTLYINGYNTWSSNFRVLQDAPHATPGASNSGDGWTVGTTVSGRYCAFKSGTKQTAATFGASSQITSAPTNTAKDAYRTQLAYHANFDSGTWAFNFNVRASSANGQQGRFRLRVWASSSPTCADGGRELTSGAIDGDICTAISSTTTDYAANISWAAPAIKLTDEYLFIQLEWKTETAGSGASSDILFRYGTSYITTANCSEPYVIWETPSSGSTSTWGGSTFRNLCGANTALTRGGQKLRVHVLTDSPTNFTAGHVSVGISNGTASNTTTTPTEVLFGGASGFSVTYYGACSSDILDYTWSSSDVLVVTCDFTAGVPFASAVQATTPAYYKTGTSYNDSAPTGMSTGTKYQGVIKLEALPSPLIATTGTFALTGNNATLLHNRNALACTTATFALTGYSAELRNISLIASTGAFALTGNAATLLHDRNCTTAVGAFYLTGYGMTFPGGLVYSVTIPDSVSITGYDISLTSRSSVSIENEVRSIETIRVAQPLSLSETAGVAETALSYDFRPGAFVHDVISWQESTLENVDFEQLLADSIILQDAVNNAIPVASEETIGIAEAYQIVLGLVTLDRLFIAPSAAAKATLAALLADALSFSETFRNFFAGDIAETISFVETELVQYRPRATLSDSVSIAAALGYSMTFRIVASDVVDIAPADLLHMVYKGDPLLDGVQLSAAYVSPQGTFTTWVVNTRLGYTTEYDNFVFNSFARMGHSYIGANSEGLYLLEGNRDDGADIIAEIKSGALQFAGSHFTSFRAAYLGLRGEGDFVFRLIAGDGRIFNYAVKAADMRSTKVNLGKGLRARYFTFQLISTGSDFDLDSVEFVPISSQRRAE